MFRRYRALLAFSIGATILGACSGDGGGSSGPLPTIAVTPQVTTMDEGSFVQLQVTSDGAAAAATFSSSSTAVVEVSSSGLVTAVGPGTATVTVALAAFPTQTKSLAITVNDLQGLGLTKNLVVVVAGTAGTTSLYRIYVPSGTTELTVASSGGTGDVDLYVRHGEPPGNFPSSGTCASTSAETTEDCTFTNPQAGTWYILLDAFDDYSGVALVATYTP